MDPYLQYLMDGSVPEGVKPSSFRASAVRFTLRDGVLYHRAFSMPLLRCVTEEESARILEEVHSGLCGNHEGPRALLFKLQHYGYYWPRMREDVEDFVRRCGPCQRYAPIPRAPPADQIPLFSPIPFARWGMDFIGELPRSTGQARFVLVAVDYFTKWVEAEAMATTTADRTISFIRRNIMCRYGVPKIIVADNGPQFRSARLEDYCNAHGIELRLTSVAHPQANGQTEAVNKTIQNALKKRLDGAKNRWAEELPAVLWSHRTTTRSATGHTPFELAFGAEARLPIEAEFPSHRERAYTAQANEQLMLHRLDLLEDTRTQAREHMDRYKAAVAERHNRSVRPRTFVKGDQVLRRAAASAPDLARGKLSPTWEGPYTVHAAHASGSYELSFPDGRLLPRRWHAINLAKFNPPADQPAEQPTDGKELLLV